MTPLLRIAGPLLAGMVVAVLMGSCAGASCPRETFRSATDLLAAYRSMRAPMRVIRAEARVDRRDAEGRIRGTVLMLLERPDRVRFDVMTQFGPAAVLTSDGAQFALTDLRENRFFVGPSCAENIERLLGLPLEGRDVARFLLGETPLIEASSEDVACDGGHYIVTRRAEGGATQTLTFDVRQGDAEAAPAEQRLRLRATEVRAPDGTLDWRVRFDDHRVIEDPADTETPHRGVAMPFRVQFEQPARGIDTMVRFVSIELSPSIPEGAFRQDPRPGLPVEPVECDL